MQLLKLLKFLCVGTCVCVYLIMYVDMHDTHTSTLYVYMFLFFGGSKSFLAAANLPPKARLRLSLGTPLFSLSVSN